tara:strand:+ start:806 stop:1090 length:285 start_codon:yes stop_codon:yes gene_type:complete
MAIPALRRVSVAQLTFNSKISLFFASNSFFAGSSPSLFSSFFTSSSFFASGSELYHLIAACRDTPSAVGAGLNWGRARDVLGAAERTLELRTRD